MYYFIFLLSSILCTNTLGMECPLSPYHHPGKEFKKARSLYKKIVKREAHKAQYNADKIARLQEVKDKEWIGQDYSNALHEKLAITLLQGINLSTIHALTSNEIFKKYTEIQKRNQRLSKKFNTVSKSMEILIGKTRYNKIISSFWQTTQIQLERDMEHFDMIAQSDGALFFMTQHTRQVQGAIVWATSEILIKHINQEK